VGNEGRDKQLVEVMFESESADAHAKESEGEREKIRLIQATLHSKAYVHKVLNMLPMPKSFMWLMIVCGLVVLVALGLGVSEYVIFVNLFAELQLKVSIMYSQAIEYVHVIKAGGYILQAISISE
jgi:hypothetical protein